MVTAGRLLVVFAVLEAMLLPRLRMPATVVAIVFGRKVCLLLDCWAFSVLELLLCGCFVVFPATFFAFSLS